MTKNFNEPQKVCVTFALFEIVFADQASQGNQKVAFLVPLRGAIFGGISDFVVFEDKGLIIVLLSFQSI